MKSLLLIFYSLTLSFLLYAGHGLADGKEQANECTDFLTKTLADQTESFSTMRERFIGSLRLEEYLSHLIDFMSDGSIRDEAGRIPLHELPDYVKANLPDVPQDAIDTMTSSISDMDRDADCFHFGRRLDDKVMKLRSHSIKRTDNPYIGYQLPREPNQPRRVKVTEAKRCYQGECPFEIKQVSELDRDTILLVHRLGRYSIPVISEAELEDPQSKTATQLPARSYLIELNLKEVGEYFTKPEIYMHLSYFNGDKLVREDTVEIPWAKQKGINSGQTELIVWLHSESVQLTLMESDWNIPIRLIAKILGKAVNIAMTIASMSHPEVAGIQSGLETLKNRSETESDDFYDALEQVNKDDLLDTIRLSRTSSDTHVPMKKGTVKMTLRHDYSPKVGQKDEF
jgi:hypothetical protein